MGSRYRRGLLAGNLGGRVILEQILYDNQRFLWHLRDGAGRLLVVIGPTTLADAICTAAILRPTAKQRDLTPA